MCNIDNFNLHESELSEYRLLMPCIIEFAKLKETDDFSGSLH